MAIHVQPNDCGEFEIWSDCEPGHYHSGRCIGLGDTLDEAKADALKELREDAAAVSELSIESVRVPARH